MRTRSIPAHSADLALAFFAVSLAIVGLGSCSGTGAGAMPAGLYAVLKTAKGDITIKLTEEQTPLTVASFVGLAEGSLGPKKGARYFDGLAFHRVEAGFVIQGGDPKGDGSGGPGYEFPNELVPGLNFDSEGVVGMANAGPDTNGSQFFITLAPASFLNGGYTVFGKVTEGMDVAKKIAVGDKIAKVTILRSGTVAKAFKADQASFDARKATLAAANAKKAAAAREATIAEIKKQWPDLARGDDGIFSKVTKAGSGATPPSGATVSVNYKGMFLDGKVFDESAKHGGPMDFQVGQGKVIPGWDRTVQKMRTGEKRFVIIPPELAYGSAGAGGVIPPDSFLVFEVELVGIKN
jgi:peptidylprolyl isomerase